MSFQYKNCFLTLAAIDFDGLVNFYCQLLEQSPHPYFPQSYAEFQLLGLRLGIFAPKSDHQQEFSHSIGSGFSLCFAVVNLEAVIAHLTAMGYPPLGKIITASHGREIYAYDPEDNRLILYQSG
jgi:predicted enzyme related to lactoylglutathione lyase